MYIPLIVLITGLLMIAYERTRPGRTWPDVCGWWTRAIFLNSLQALTVYVAGVSWDRWLGVHHHGMLEGLNSTLGGFIGYFVITFVFYWWHRFRHQSNFLWRWFHQVHHSPQKLEIATAFYKHPFELIADSILCSIVLYPICGLSPESAMCATLLSGLAELFYHWNIKTPRWIGYFFQRPESHCVHHQNGLHAYNYSDLPLWDMLFGTFRNPKTFDARCGLDDHEDRLVEMFMGKDVYKNKRKKVTSPFVEIDV
ncbi:MAG: sterol desaturase family protein [Chlamydiia bacterium]